MTGEFGAELVALTSMVAMVEAREKSATVSFGPATNLLSPKSSSVQPSASCSLLRASSAIGAFPNITGICRAIEVGRQSVIKEECSKKPSRAHTCQKDLQREAGTGKDRVSQVPTKKNRAKRTECHIGTYRTVREGQSVTGICRTGWKGQNVTGI